MSFKLTALMLDHGPSDPLAKLVALALCDRADENGICWPSRSDLRARTGAADATITRKLRALESAGFIQRRQRFNNSSVFRVNAAKLQELELQAQREKAVVIPHGFEAFPEETAQLQRAQAIENKGDAHREHTVAHREHTVAHAEHLTYQKSTNQPCAVAKSAPVGASTAPSPALPCEGQAGAGASELQAGAGASELQVIAEGLDTFQRDCLRDGQSFLVKGALFKPNSLEFHRLAQAAGVR